MGNEHVLCVCVEGGDVYASLGPGRLYKQKLSIHVLTLKRGQWLSGRVLDSRPKGPSF